MPICSFGVSSETLKSRDKTYDETIKILVLLSKSGSRSPPRDENVALGFHSLVQHLAGLTFINKGSAAAEMGNRLAIIDTGQKLRA